MAHQNFHATTQNKFTHTVWSEPRINNWTGGEDIHPHINWLFLFLTFRFSSYTSFYITEISCNRHKISKFRYSRKFQRSNRRRAHVFTSALPLRWAMLTALRCFAFARKLHSAFFCRRQNNYWGAMMRLCVTWSLFFFSTQWFCRSY